MKKVLVIIFWLFLYNIYGIEIFLYPTNHLARKGETIGLVVRETEENKVVSVSLEDSFNYNIYRVDNNIVYSIIGIPHTIATNFNIVLTLSNTISNNIWYELINFNVSYDVLSYAKRKPKDIKDFNIYNDLNFKTNRFRLNTNYTGRISLFVVPIPGEIGDGYGVNRSRGGTLYGRIHLGIDILRERGAKVYSTSDGVVAITSYDRKAGNYVVVDHGYGVASVYMHLSKINVRKGQFVDTNTVIGLVGSTGRSVGPHLHFGISVNNVYVDPIIFFERDYTVQSIISNGMRIILSNSTFADTSNNLNQPSS
ncbi:MAG: M23 family metallopeptidase [Spirochaetia bacterium]|nr:M23 family metallopeptidase [Spirochaetota bacterium]MDW8112690.1 M23 family metallopeptidase [Spirochaetia bacterium]